MNEIDYIIAFVNFLHRIYKHKMYCKLHSLDETCYNIFQQVKFSVMKDASILKNFNALAEYSLFEKFVLAL
jgi:uncharacterized protein YktA (UPF0223 family)